MEPIASKKKKSVESFCSICIYTRFSLFIVVLGGWSRLVFGPSLDTPETNLPLSDGRLGFTEMKLEGVYNDGSRPAEWHYVYQARENRQRVCKVEGRGCIVIGTEKRTVKRKGGKRGHGEKGYFRMYGVKTNQP